jgi:hypothetical protein
MQRTLWSRKEIAGYFAAIAMVVLIIAMSSALLAARSTIKVEFDGFPARGQCVEDEFQIQDRCFHIGDARKVG